MKRSVLLFICSSVSALVMAQSSPNLINSAPSSPTTQEAGKLSGVSVNIFTGVPSVSVPIYSYSNANNGLSLNISLSYYAGGTQVAQEPTTVGLGWFLSAGGVINRTVRGVPDDFPQYGYLNSSAIPTDFRSNGTKYYYDSLDREQDVFQFSFGGRSGGFYIGKNQQVVLTSVSKLKVIPTTGTGYLGVQGIISFRIITEDGMKYDFKDAELTQIIGGNTNIFNSGNSARAYFSSWYLSQIISPFNTDTIKFNYTQKSLSNSISFPQTTFVRDADGVRTATYTANGYNTSTINKISSIVFPDKTNVSFIYGNYNYSADDNALSKIKISDTNFRNGYLLDYQNSISYGVPCKLLLKSVTPYTAKEKMRGYSFTYNLPLFPLPGSYGDTIQNKRDFWGFYNAANNGTTLIPKINNYTWGANRDPVFYSAYANSLNYFYLPGGGVVFYEYELNDHYPYLKDPKSLGISANTNSQNTITLNQVFSTKHQIVLKLDNSVSRTGNAPISGNGDLIFTIKSTDGSVTYATKSISLYDLFYLGMKTWSFNLSNGNYRLETQLSGGTTISVSFPINLTWENRLIDNTKSLVTSGGLRIKKVTRYNLNGDDVFQSAETEEYKYITEDGKSSGFLGDIPKYDYPYQENNSGSITNYTVVSSEPVNNMSYAQGSTVGYSRVEVYKGTATHNMGKTVYEFTNLQDVNINASTASFPYAPQDIRDWGLGLPKKISVYDSLNTLVKRTVNTIAVDTVIYQNTDFKSLKLGHSATVISSTPNVKTYIGQEYYPSGGRVYITASADTLFQSNGSVNTSASSYVYDTNYNVTKVVTSYDRNRGLQLEQRLYYPYNYTIGGIIGKLRDSAIISAVVAKESWITGDANPRILSGEITGFKQLSSGYIRPDTVFSLESNKPVAQSAIGVFDPSKLNRNTSYFKPQLSYLNYDLKGNLLQVLNLKSGQSSSMIMDYGQQYAVAKISNSTTSDVAYSSFESDGSGNWTIGSATRDLTSALTGKKSYNLSNGNITKAGLSSAQSYLLTVWAKTGASVTVNGSSLSTSIAQQNGWNLYTVSLSGITSITVSGSGLIDELRLHPKNANMVTSTYEPMVGITSAVDANNTVMYNEYDNLNRLKLVRDKDFNIIKRYDYSDSSMIITVLPVWGNGTGVCSDNGGHYDSTYTDINPYSDTYLTTRVVAYSNQATCCTGAMFKMINGVCEYATVRVNTSTSYMKIDNPNGSDPPQVWVWRCIWHWEWSDGTRASSDFTEYNSSPCQIGGEI